MQKASTFKNIQKMLNLYHTKRSLVSIINERFNPHLSLAYFYLLYLIYENGYIFMVSDESKHSAMYTLHHLGLIRYGFCDKTSFAEYNMQCQCVYPTDLCFDYMHAMHLNTSFDHFTKSTYYSNRNHQPDLPLSHIYETYSDVSTELGDLMGDFHHNTILKNLYNNRLSNSYLISRKCLVAFLLKRDHTLSDSALDAIQYNLFAPYKSFEDLDYNLTPKTNKETWL